MNTRLIALALVAGLASACGGSSADTASTIVSPATSTTSSGSTVGGALAFSLSTTSLNEGQTVDLTATGGIPPYYFCIEVGANCTGYAPDYGSVNQINPSSPTYTAPDVSGSITLAVIDSSDGLDAPATVTITVGSSSGTSSSGSSGTTDVQPLVVSPSTGTYVAGEQITLTTTGGNGGYQYTSNGGGSFGNPGTNQVVFTAPSTTGSVSIQVVDQDSLVGTAQFMIIQPNTNGMTITPQQGSVGTGQSIQFATYPLTDHYTYTASMGSFSGATYFAPVTGGTATISVKDTSTGQTSSTTITVNPTYSTQQITPGQFELLVDQFAAITYYVDPANGPSFEIFGTGATRDSGSVGADGNDDPICNGAVTPCAYEQVLTNWSNGAPVTYRGTISIAGRSASETVAFCIPPSNTNIAYLNQTPNANQTYSQVAFSEGNTLFGGVLTETFFTDVDSESGYGEANVNFAGGYTANLNCSDFPNYTVSVDTN